MFLKRVNFFGKHTTETYGTWHCSQRRRWNSRSEQPRCWNVRNLGVARCLIGQAGHVNHESASSQIFEWMQLLCPTKLTSETDGSCKIIADCLPLSASIIYDTVIRSIIDKSSRRESTQAAKITVLRSYLILTYKFFVDKKRILEDFVAYNIKNNLLKLHLEQKPCRKSIINPSKSAFLKIYEAISF